MYDLCFREGQAGNCGPDCEAFLQGDCEVEDEIYALMDEDEKRDGIPWQDIVESQVMEFI